MKEQLETLIDRHGVANLLTSMKHICYEKRGKLLESATSC